MKTKDTYFVKFENGTSAWLAVGKEVPEDAISSEVRVMLFPSKDKILKNKTTGEFTDGIWLKDTTVDDYEETDRAEYELAEKERMDAEDKARIEG